MGREATKFNFVFCVVGDAREKGTFDRFKLEIFYSDSEVSVVQSKVTVAPLAGYHMAPPTLL